MRFNKTRIGIVEDKPVLRNHLVDRLKRFQHLQTTMVFPNGEVLLNVLRQTDPEDYPDIILMDIEMDKMNGIEATSILNEEFPSIQVIILTVFDDDEKVFSAIQSGASGYLLKEEKADAIVEAIEEVMKGHAFMSPAIARKTLTFLKNVKVKKEEEKLLKAEDYHLTQREIEILECVNDGLTYNQIAEKLFISSETVKSHIKNIFQKLQVNSKLVAAQIALKNKWFERRG